jgi:hypothetical protein
VGIEVPIQYSHNQAAWRKGSGERPASKSSQRSSPKLVVQSPKPEADLPATENLPSTE